MLEMEIKKNKNSMGRIGNQCIDISKIKIEIKDNLIIGTYNSNKFEMEIPSDFNIIMNNDLKQIKIENNNIIKKAVHGTIVARLKNNCKGLVTPFIKIIYADGVGYRIDISGQEITFKLSKSHLVKKNIDKNIKIEVVNKTSFKLICCDKELLGQCTAEILKIEKYSVYGKNKGLKERSQFIRKKSVNKK